MKRRLALAAVAALAAGIVYAVWFASVFDVRTVRVFGTHYISRSEVLAAARITLGEPLARVRTAEVESRVAGLRTVASVDVRRGFPHAVVIDVHERVAIAAAAGANDSWWLVDKTGTQFLNVPVKPARLLAVEGYTERFRGIGARTAARFPTWLQRRVASVTVYAPEDVRLRMKSGKEVRWGGESRAERKAEVLFALLRIRARLYDVSAPDAPATSA